MTMSSKKKKRSLEDYFQPMSKKRKLDTNSDKPETWSCSACTFINFIQYTKCQICNTQKISKEIGKIKVKIDSPKCITFNLKGNSTVLWYQSYLNPNFCDILFKELMNIRYEQPTLFIWGKKRNIPRLQSWMNDGNLLNKEANLYQKQECILWTDNMLLLKKELECLCGVQFSYCLINQYRNGKDYIGYHCDDEARNKHCNVIASISLGEIRKFVLRHIDCKNDKKNKNLKHEFMLNNGCLIIMKDDTQKHWQHAIMKSTKLNKPRINLTFRQKK